MARTSLTGRQCRLPNKLVDKLTEHDVSLDAIMGDGVLAVSEVVAANGAISVVTPVTELNLSGTKTYTLAAGTKHGQKKRIYVSTAASTPNLTITGNFYLQGAQKTSIAHSSAAALDGVDLIWDSTVAAWQIARQDGTLTIT
jgi:hypothetical protein